jgi:hypothetical protein
MASSEVVAVHANRSGDRAFEVLRAGSLAGAETSRPPPNPRWGRSHSLIVVTDARYIWATSDWIPVPRTSPAPEPVHETWAEEI